MTKQQANRTARRSSSPAASTEHLSESGRLGAAILAERNDLRPSVERILHAGLNEETATRALVLFRDSLTVVGDPHRDPRIAIARASEQPSEPLEPR